jgi:transposase InsO family protein
MSKNRMYVISAPIITPMCLKTTKQEETLLWHDRYAHLSFKGLSTLAKKQMVKGLPELAEVEEKCVDCLTGKQSRDSIPNQANWRASTKLELVHSDICGPITPQSNGGSRYFITFTDDFSRKTWVYLLKEKSNAFEIFKNFKALIEKESGNSIQCLRTDRGGEYLSNAFNEFCSMEGIKRQLTAAYTPQQNGVSERKNMTLLNMVRSMINAKKVPKQFWPEAVKWATYVMNRSPTLNVKNMTPEEAWSGVRPSVHFFRVFWCICHVHIHDNQRKKLDNKSKKCVLLGVSEESKAYKLYDPVDKKIIISRDVVFEESKAWEWNKSQKSDNKLNQNDYNDEWSQTDEIPDETEEMHDNEDAIVENTTSESEDEATPIRQARVRKTPARFNDFITGREAEEEDELHNLAVFNSPQDPSTYEEAMKMKVWREAMSAEMESIKRNDT